MGRVALHVVELGSAARSRHYASPATHTQLPSAAENPSGPYLPKELTEHRPTLQSEFQKLALEAALDAALEDVRKRKAATATASAAAAQP